MRPSEFFNRNVVLSFQEGRHRRCLRGVMDYGESLDYDDSLLGSRASRRRERDRVTVTVIRSS